MSELNKKEYKIVNSLSEIPEGFFTNNQSIKGILFKGLHFEAYKFSSILVQNSYFEDCTFEGCFFDICDFQRVHFSNCGFDNCILSNQFRYITGTIQDTKFIEVDFTSAFMQNVKFNESNFDTVEFDRIKAKSIEFWKCSFEKVTFEGANIVRGHFKEVIGIQRNLFYNSVLDDCNFDWNEAFIVMQFNDAINDNLYTYGIEEVLKARGIEPKRVDRYEFKGKITEEIMINITTSKLVIAECTASNKNVFFEVGYALGRNKKIIFLIDDAKNIPFDLKDYQFIIHGGKIDTLKPSLASRIDFLMST